MFAQLIAMPKIVTYVRSPTSIDNTTNRDKMIIIVIWMKMMRMITQKQK